MAQSKNNINGLVYSTNPTFIQDEIEEIKETLIPTKQTLKVKIDTKQRGGKVVTLVEGFVGTLGDLEQLGKQLKNKCGTGGAVKDQVIIVQGDHKVKIIALLQSLNYKIKS